MKIATFFAATTALVILAGSQVDATTIGFDDLVGGTSLFAPVDVSTRYAALGVTFSDTAGVSGALQASAINVTPTSAPNVFFATQHQATDVDDLKINFAAGSKAVSLTTFDSASYQTFYFAYGAGGALIDSGSLAPNSTYGAPQLLSLSEPSAIYQLVLTTHPENDSGYFGNFSFDDLTFAGASVPEPASWAMMILGFGLAGAAIRRRARGVAFA